MQSTLSDLQHILGQTLQIEFVDKPDTINIVVSGLDNLEEGLLPAYNDVLGTVDQSGKEIKSGVRRGEGATNQTRSQDIQLDDLFSSPLYEIESLAGNLDKPISQDSVGKTIVSIENETEEVMFKVLVDTSFHTVIFSEAHSNTDERMTLVLSEYCKIIQNLTLQEASDHGIYRLEKALRKGCWTEPVQGIFLPGNVFWQFRVIQDSTRAVLQKYRSLAGYKLTENSYDPSPSSMWSGLSRREQMRHINEVFNSTMLEMGFANCAAEVVKIEYNVRVTIRLKGLDVLGQINRQEMLMALEKSVKQQIEPRLEIYQEPVRDLNKLRRRVLD